MVATAHLDTVWRWTIADTVEKFEDANTAKMKSGKTVEFDVLCLTWRVLTDTSL